MKLHTSISMGCLAGFVVLITACAVGHPVHYYSMNVPPESEKPAQPEGLVLLVGQIKTPEALEDGRIRYRNGDNEVGAYEFHRWTDRPGVMVRDLLIRTLRASGHFRQVQELGSTGGGDYVIRGKLYEFAEVDSPSMHTRVSLHLELVDRKTGFVVWDHDYNRDEPISGKQMAEVVVSLEHNMQQAIGEAATGIEERLRR